MTSTVALTRPRLTRRTKIVFAVLFVLAGAWVAYFAKFGQCDFHSKFCVVNIAGTRSEIGVEWDSWSLYVSTWGNDPATHVLIQL